MIKNGFDILIIAYGPLFLKNAYMAALEIDKIYNISVGVMNFPWLNRIDEFWMSSNINQYKEVFVIDNHYYEGGLGQRLGAFLNKYKIEKQINCICLENIPSSGQPDEVLANHKMDIKSIVNIISKTIDKS